ncbi:uncharacterized protein TNCV_356291 [Trichonephila clavipes]|nr:uncharacterized protein TNCV_356291 [Trichonephila clavipes]
MQISAENLQEELDLRHVENHQMKKELEKLIQDYKPEKTASTDVTMRIILKDEEPVCQHPRRLAFTERQNISEYYAKKELITRIARWALQLEEFDYEIEHRAGSRMKHVDALSRYPVMMVCNDTLTSKLKKAQEEDDNIQSLKSLLEKQESEEFLSEMKRCKKNIEDLQSENRKTYNRRRKKASLYKEGDLVAIQRTQFGAGLKLRPKFLGPYKVTKANSRIGMKWKSLVSTKDRTQPPPQRI